MTRSIRVLFLAILLFTLSCQSVHVNTPGNPDPNPNPNAGGNSTTFTAASCSYTDVSDCINGTGANTCHLPGGSTGTHTAVNGDTIKIPAGSCAYTSMLIVPVLVHFIGSDPSNPGQNVRGSTGGGQTVLTDNVDKSNCGNNPMIRFDNETQGDGTMEIGNITVQGGVVDPGQCAEHIGVHTASYSLRIHDMTFQSMTSTGILVDGDEQGVFDHNTFASSTTFKRGIIIHHQQYQGVGHYGDNSWAQPDTMGTAEAFFVENNVFNITTPNGVGNVACEYGARCVVRYNDIETLGTHGTDTSLRNRSVRQLEVYNNNVRDNGNKIPAAFTEWRGGTGVFFNNTITPTVSGNYSGMLSLAIYRETDGWIPFGPSILPWNGMGGCWGISPFDTNGAVPHASGIAGSSSATDTLVDTTRNWATNQWVGYSLINPANVANPNHPWGSTIISNTSNTITTYRGNGAGVHHQWTGGDTYQVLHTYPCLDQPGRGMGAYISGNSPSPAGPVNEAPDPVYSWGNQYCDPNCALSSPSIGVYYQHIQPNRDFYDFVVSGFNGAVGVGQGLLSARPTTCTPLVAYWATDMNTLYQCVSTNTWVQYYAPYTYPHPLTASQ